MSCTDSVRDLVARCLIRPICPINRKLAFSRAMLYTVHERSFASGGRIWIDRSLIARNRCWTILCPIIARAATRPQFAKSGGAWAESSATVHVHLRGLERLGYITRAMTSIVRSQSRRTRLPTGPCPLARCCRWSGELPRASRYWRSRTTRRPIRFPASSWRGERFLASSARREYDR